MPRIAHVVARSTEKYAQRIQAARHRILADEPTAHGGTDTGPAPYFLLLASLGACTSITLRMYAERKGWELGEIDVDLNLIKDEGKDRIERRIRFSAPLQPGQRAKLAEIAEKTPVTLTLRQGAAIETRIDEDHSGSV